jgi:hypothetical protein
VSKPAAVNVVVHEVAAEVEEVEAARRRHSTTA